jgi:hypothetical protein
LYRLRKVNLFLLPSVCMRAYICTYIYIYIYEVSVGIYLSKEPTERKKTKTDKILVFQEEELHYCLVRSKYGLWEKGQDYKVYEINKNK